MLALERVPAVESHALLRQICLHRWHFSCVISSRSRGAQPDGRRPEAGSLGGALTPAYAAAHLKGNDPPSLDDPVAVLAEMQEPRSARSPKPASTCGAQASPWSPPAISTPMSLHGIMLNRRRAAACRRLTCSTSPRRAGVCGDFFGGLEGHEGVEAAAISGRSNCGRCCHFFSRFDGLCVWGRLARFFLSERNS